MTMFPEEEYSSGHLLRFLNDPPFLFWQGNQDGNSLCTRHVEAVIHQADQPITQVSQLAKVLDSPPFFLQFRQVIRAALGGPSTLKVECVHL